MAWRPNAYLIHGILDNRIKGKITGELRFHGMTEPITLDLEGDFHRDIRGKRIHLFGSGSDAPAKAAEYMDGMASHQTGIAGDITAGLEPTDYVDYPYIEWYGEANGRVVLELNHDQVVVEACERPPTSVAEASLVSER